MRLMKMRGFIFGFFLTAVLLPSGFSFAQETLSDGPDDGSQYRQELGRVITIKEDELPYELDSYVRYMPSRGAEYQSGKVAVTEAASEFSYDTKVFGELPVEWALGARYIGINNTTAVELPSRLTQMTTGIEANFPFFFDKTYLTVGLGAAIYSCDWKANSSSFRLPQRYFLIHQPNDKLTLVAGIEVIPDFEDAVSPLLGFIYNPNDRLSFSITPDQPEITYKMDDEWSAFLQANKSDEEFEVSRGDLKNVVLEYNEMHFGGGLRFQPNKYVQTSFSAGYIFNRSLKYRDEGLGKVSVKDGMYTEFRIDISV